MAHIRIDHPDGKSDTYPIKGMLLIGRAEGSHILLLDTSVSRRHARIYGADGNYHITNLSAAGIKVNGHPTSTTRLKHGDVIQVGNRKLIFNKDMKQAIEQFVDLSDDEDEVGLVEAEEVLDLTDFEDDSALERLH